MYFTLSPYQEILAGMQTALAVNEGIIKLTGTPGSGKTALCSELYRELTDRGQDVVFFLNPPKNGEDMQQSILRQLQLNTSGNFTRQLTAHLLASETEHRTLVLIFDDAQQIDETTFTSIRLLCNIQSNTQSLIRIIICGSQLLDERLEAYSFRALTQFLSQSFTLPPMTREQAADLCCVYWQQIGVMGIPFDAKEMLAVYKETAGLPGALLEKLQQEAATVVARPPARPDPLASQSTAPVEDDVTGSRRGRALIAAGLLLLCAVGALGYRFLIAPEQNEAPQLSSIRAVQSEAPPAVEDVAVATPQPTPLPEPAVTQQAALPATATLEQTPPPELVEAEEPAAVESLSAATAPAAEPLVVAEAPPLLSETSAAAEASPALQSADGFSADLPGAAAQAFVTSWTQSWQTKDMDSFLAHYHRDFSTPYADSVAQWREQRRQNIATVRDLNLSFDRLESRGGSAAVQTLRFWLRYRSATYADDTHKEFILQLQDGEWRIRSERNLQIIRH